MKFDGKTQDIMPKRVPPMTTAELHAGLTKTFPGWTWKQRASRTVTFVGHRKGAKAHVWVECTYGLELHAMDMPNMNRFAVSVRGSTLDDLRAACAALGGMGVV